MTIHAQSIAEYAREETLISAAVLSAAEQATQDVYRDNPDIEGHYAGLGRLPLAVVIGDGGIFSESLNPFIQYLPAPGQQPEFPGSRPIVMDRAAAVFYNGVRKFEDHLDFSLFRNISHIPTADQESAYQAATLNLPRWMLNALAKDTSMRASHGLLSLDRVTEGLFLPFGALNKAGGVSIEGGKTRISTSGLLQPDDSIVSRAVGWGLDLARKKGLSVASDDQIDMIEIEHDLREKFVDVLTEDAEDIRDISNFLFDRREMASLSDIEVNVVLNNHLQRRLAA